jgi:hypothetical protein
MRLRSTGVHVNEIGRKDAVSLSSQELLPGWAGAARRRINPGIMQDLPHRGDGDCGHHSLACLALAGRLREDLIHRVQVS